MVFSSIPQPSTSAGTYRIENRVLICQHCGAGMAATLQPCTLTCSHCGAVHNVRMRPDAALRAPAAASESERLQRLGAQDTRAPMAPSMITLIAGGVVPRAKTEQAFAVWQQLRTNALMQQGGPAPEEFVCLTLALSTRLLADGDRLRQRAVLDSALEVVQEPRHQQLVRAYLVEAAAASGDLGAAQAWLSTLDPRSQDLQGDTAWRFASACIATAAGQPTQVLQVLGCYPRDVPMSDVLSTECAVLRASAWERLGQPSVAIDLLLDIKLEGGPMARHRATRFLAMHAGWQLCAGAEPAAQQRFQSMRMRIAAHRNVVLVFLASMFGWALLSALAAVALMPVAWTLGVGNAWNVLSPIMWLMMTAIMGGITLFAWMRSRRRRRVRERGTASPAIVLKVRPPAQLMPGFGGIATDLWVMPDEAPPFPLTVQLDLLPYQLPRVTEGAVVMVWHLPGESEFTVVDVSPAG
jgi:hypothetical protein